MNQFRCTIHNIKHTAEDLTVAHKDDRGYIMCPYCAILELEQTREKLKIAERHRAVLLEAIEIKHTQVLIHDKEQP